MKKSPTLFQLTRAKCRLFRPALSGCILCGALILLSLLSLTGCVERLITVNSEPPGAIVWLNDEEVGATPVTVPFTWYGKYGVVIRKDDYQTVNTVKDVPAPFYQWPPLDLVAECFLPFKITDHHQWSFSLNPQTPTDTNQLIKRAKDLRHETLNSP